MIYERKDENVGGRYSWNSGGRLMSVNVYAVEEKDVIGTWYVNELSMGEGLSFHPGAIGMEVTVDVKEGGKMETTSSSYGEEPEVDQSEWKIENDKF